MDAGELFLLFFVLGLWALSIYYFLSRYKKISTIERAEGPRSTPHKSDTHKSLTMTTKTGTDVPSSDMSLLKASASNRGFSPHLINTYNANGFHRIQDEHRDVYFLTICIAFANTNLLTYFHLCFLEFFEKVFIFLFIFP